MLAEGSYLEITFFIQMPGDHHQRLQPGVPILLLHLGVFKGRTNGDLNTMKTQAPGAANRPMVSPEWGISHVLLSTSSSRHSTIQGLQPRGPSY